MRSINIEKATISQLAAFIAGDDSAVSASFIAKTAPKDAVALLSEDAEKLFPGAGKEGILKLRCALELCRRCAAGPGGQPSVIRNSADAFSYLEPVLKDLKQEHFLTVTLDAAGKVTGHTTVSVGTLTSSQAHARDVFRTAVIKNAHSVILAHNHPSGDPSPSREDLEITPVLADAGRILGIRVTDHIIVGDGRYYSFTDAGRIVL